MSDPVEFSFVVQGDKEEWFPLDLRPYDEQSGKYLSGVWQRLAGAVDKDCGLRNAKPANWVQWKPWEWCGSKRPDYADRNAWMAWCGNRLVGFLNVWANFDSQHESGQKVLYIEHLAAFPGDQNTELWRRRYRHVGKALLAFAIRLSDKGGFGGRLGLHSENDESLAWYRAVAADREVPLFQPEKTGIIGPTPHGTRSDGNLTYLETTSDGSIKFLEDYRHE